MTLLKLADVPVPDTVQVYVPHIVAVNGDNLLSVDLDFTLEVVLGFSSAANTWLVPPINSVLLILELHLARELVAHRPHKNVVDTVV